MKLPKTTRRIAAAAVQSAAVAVHKPDEYALFQRQLRAGTGDLVEACLLDVSTRLHDEGDHQKENGERGDRSRLVRP